MSSRSSFTAVAISSDSGKNLPFPLSQQSLGQHGDLHPGIWAAQSIQQWLQAQGRFAKAAKDHLVKAQIALAKGKQAHDKRQDKRDKDWDRPRGRRDLARALHRTILLARADAGQARCRCYLRQRALGLSSPL